MLHNKRHTSTVVGLVFPTPATILCHQKLSERRTIGIDFPGRLGNGGDSTGGDLTSRLAELFETLLDIHVACEFFLTYN